MTSEANADAHVDALQFSVTRLAEMTSPLTAATLTGRAYPSEWSIAQVLSHLGSGAVIMQRRLEDTLAGRPTPDDYAPSIWDSWNAKTPTEQRDDAIAADADLLARIESVTAEQRSGFTFVMGPISVGFTEFLGLRLNEHGMHTWDVDVAIDPAAIIPSPVADLVVDNLDLIARYTGKPTGDTITITVATTAPERGFTIELAPDSVTVTPGIATGGADVALPAEAFARLVYGRLDPEHTPPDNHAPALTTLRRVFPGP